MADFYGCLESTTFAVRNRVAFLADPDVIRLMDYARSEGFFDEVSEGQFAFGWYGQYPSVVLTTWNNALNDDDELDITEVLQRHVQSGTVCQIGISGNEKLRYIGGLLAYVTEKGCVTWDGTTTWDETLDPQTLLASARTFVERLTEIL